MANADKVARERAVQVLKTIEFAYPPADALAGQGGSWMRPARCPLCFSEWPKHRDECAVAEVIRRG